VTNDNHDIFVCGTLQKAAAHVTLIGANATADHNGCGEMDGDLPTSRQTAAHGETTTERLVIPGLRLLRYEIASVHACYITVSLLSILVICQILYVTLGEAYGSGRASPV